MKRLNRFISNENTAPDTSYDLLNSFTAEVALMHPKKIVQSKLRRRLAKASSELGLHYFLFHIAKTHKLTNIVDLLYSFLSKIKYNIE